MGNPSASTQYFQPKLAGVTENGLAVAVHVLVKSKAGSSLGEHLF